MCENLQRARAKALSYITSKNADAMYGLVDRIREAKLAYCEEHAEKAEQLAKFVKEAADRLITEHFAD